MSIRAGLRAEIIINLIVLLAAALVFGSILQLKVSERELLRERVSVVEALFSSLAEAIAPTIGRGEGESLARVIPDGVDVRQMVVVDGEQNPLLSYRSREGLRPANGDLVEARITRQIQVRVDYDGSWWPGPDPEKQRMLISVPMDVAGGGYVLQADVSLADLRGRLLDAQKPVVIYLLLFGVVLVVFGSILIGRSIVYPLRRLVQATRKVTDGEFDADVAATGLHEVAELSTSFNDMTSALRTSRQETADHIDELNRANKELSDTRDELIRSEKLATVGHLAAGMAHEIGNPLGALTGYLGLLEQEAGEESRELVGRAQGEAGRIDRLVRELLDYAAPGHMSSEPFDALAALREALQLLEEQQAMEGLTLKVTMPESLPETCGSHAKLVQVFLNLLLNARDASLPSGELSVSADQTDDSLVFRIEDNGAGIPTDILPHIFDPFYTTKPQGKGRGLGLAVCYHIVTEMGGRIDVNSQPGHGSCFTIYLPLCGEKKP